jgi:hypothetical protein
MLFELDSRRVQPRKDPALLDIARLERWLGVAGIREDQPCDVPELVRELPALLDEAVREPHVLR